MKPNPAPVVHQPATVAVGQRICVPEAAGAVWVIKESGSKNGRSGHYIVRLRDGKETKLRVFQTMKQLREQWTDAE